MQPLSIAALPLAHRVLDREDPELVSPDLFDRLWARSDTRLLTYHQGRVAMVHGRPLASSPDAVPAATVRVFLGTTRASLPDVPVGTPLVAMELSDSGLRAFNIPDAEWQAPRQALATPDPTAASLLMTGFAIMHWHADGAYCPRCGMPTMVQRGGWMRRCMGCDAEIFPRTDPAVIVAILDARDRLLLGRRVAGTGRWSILAGFIEAGESAEMAIVREIHEEAGITVVPGNYLGSQPWPFPRSLMLGYEARMVDDQPLVPDGDEIAELRWFTRAELAQAAPTLGLPAYPSIARALIEQWFGGPISEGAATKDAADG